MTEHLDLDAYLRRIHWQGDMPLRPDHATLARLVEAHMRHIPFENIDVLRGLPIRIDLASLQAKMVDAHRGGYCFEHSTLMAAVLEAVGFEVARKLARVTLLAPREAVPRTHMFLLVTLEGERFVVDVGFGALAPQWPVPLRDPAADDPLDEGKTHWMRRQGAYWTLCAAHRQREAEAEGGQRGEVIQAWTSTLEDEGPADFEMGNHFVSTHPESPFVNRIMLRALTPTGRVSVMNRDVTVRSGESTETFQLTDRAHLRALLKAFFGFDCPDAEGLQVRAIPEWS